MPSVVIVTQAHEEAAIEFDGSRTLMELAIANGVDGIVAECGGATVCGTCHVYVDEESLPLLPPISAVEDDILDTTACVRNNNSRLACCIELSDALDGTKIYLPAKQRS